MKNQGKYLIVLKGDLETRGGVTSIDGPIFDHEPTLSDLEQEGYDLETLRNSEFVIIELGKMANVIPPSDTLTFSW